MDIKPRKPIRSKIKTIRSDLDESQEMYGSQEKLWDQTQFEAENYSSRSSEDEETINNTQRPESSPRLGRTSGKKSRLRTESPNRPKTQESFSQANSRQVSGIRISYILAPILVFIIIFIFQRSYVSNSSSAHELHSGCSFSDLQKKYTNEIKMLWITIKSNIDDIVTGRINKPSVTLFIHNGGRKPGELIKDIANVTSNCLDPSMNPIEFSPSDFTTSDAAKDYGLIIDKYKKTAKDGNVVMILNLNEVPAKAARALHAICDRESPIYRKVIILLSLTAVQTEGRPVDIAEKTLTDLWEGKIPDYELGPLMARVTDEVILLQSK